MCILGCTNFMITMLAGDLVDVLHVLQELATKLNSESCEKTLPYLGQLLSSCPLLDVRSAICEVLSAFSVTDSVLSFVVRHCWIELFCMQT